MIELVPQQRQTTLLSPQAQLGIRLLMRSLPELREEIVAEMSRNPAIEDFEHPLERQMSEVEREQDAVPLPDYPEDDFVPGLNHDEALAERRQVLFDRQVRAETLQEHLLRQLPLSDFAPSDWSLVESLVGELDDDGYFRGSLAEVCQAYSRPESEVEGLLGSLTRLDPPGCGARSVRECLLAQVDALEPEEDRLAVRRIIDTHLEDIAAGRFATVERAMGIDRAEYVRLLKALRTLDGRPGRQFPSVRERIEYVNPEIRAVRRQGRWVAEMDARSLPVIRLSQKFAELLRDPAQTAETKAYVRERIAAARALQEAVVRRQETVQAIADEIFDRQQDFFEKGLAALRPLTELEVAAKVGVHGTTVSRTVRDKYVSTPKGTFELRRFFATGVKTASGEDLSQQAALDALKKIVAKEDAAHPLSDEKLAEKMKAAGFPVARRTVAKYRDRLSIPGSSERGRPSL